ncbi:hypothetical protein [Corynebacterium aquilae]|uniref:Uncharacterized protein n=1 Tax=Corynebacterium aquilae DSM 44791 TaxID=1431546 RepID=A0A1L7CH79_9CORY|nr:hypothetical protein [Corynebacterium aquilae]APT85207.1 hypothetical protein CAQU_09125 [Corynebacterium aquilae DSM 44791]
MRDQFIAILDGIAQWLTGLPLVWQTIVVVLTAIPMCAILAIVLLRAIDVAGALTYKWFNPGHTTAERVRLIPARKVTKGHKPAAETRVVINTPPVGPEEPTQ